MAIRICAIVMAAGFSRRAGFNKLLYVMDGKPLARHILDTLQELNLYRVVVVTRFQELASWSEELGYKTIWNNEAVEGQASSIRLGVSAAPNCDAYMFFPADQPYITAETIRAILAEFERGGDGVVVPVYGSRRGSPVVFPSRLADALLALKGDVGGKAVIAGEARVTYLDIGDAREGQDFDVFDTIE